MYMRIMISVWLLIISFRFGLASELAPIKQPIDDLSCDLKMEFKSRYIQDATTVFAKVFAKQPGKFMLFIHWREPYGKSSVFPFEPMGLALLMDNRILTRYQLLSHEKWKDEVRPDKAAGLQFNMMEMHTISTLDSVLRNILSVHLEDYVSEDNDGAIRLIHKHSGAVLWGHKISTITCMFAADTGCLERAEYYNADDRLVCELKASKPAKLSNGKWVPTEVIAVISEGRLSVYNSDLTITVHSDGDFREERAGGEVPYPAGGLIIHRDFEIFDNTFILPSQTKFYTGTRELIATNIFSNYQINAGIDDSVFDERYLLGGIGISGVKGELLRAEIAFARLKRESDDASSYDRVIPALESITSSDNPAIAVKAYYLWIQSLIEQKNYNKAIEPIMSLLKLEASSDEFGYLWASGTAHGLAYQFIQDNQIPLAERILDKYVEYRAETGRDLVEDAYMDLINSNYFHALKLYEHIYSNTENKETKAQCQYLIACCYDMIARESMDSSSWYRTANQKRAVVNEALKHYKAFIEQYPTSRHVLWATHNAQFLEAYPIKTKPSSVAAQVKAVEQQARDIATDVRAVLHSKRAQWTKIQMDTYANNVQSAFSNVLYRVMTREEYDNFRKGFAEYCETALPDTMTSVDEFAIEVATIRWIIRHYVSGLDISNEVTEAEVNWQISQLIQKFDEFIATYLYHESLKDMISQVKKDYREALNLYQSNALYPIFKYPLSPKSSWRYETFIRGQEEVIGEPLGRYKKAAAEAEKKGRKRAVDRVWNKRIVSRKRGFLSSTTLQVFVEAIPLAYGTKFPDEFHPERIRVVQYHYLPNKGIKLTVLVDKEDYPKLGIDNNMGK